MKNYFFQGEIDLQEGPKKTKEVIYFMLFYVTEKIYMARVY